MIYAYFKGILTGLTPTKATVEIAGIGYQLLIPISVYSDLTASLGKEVFLFTSFVVREDSHRLFGFLDKRTKDLFERLSDLTGIGPKTALSIVGHLSIEELDEAIFHQDVLTLSKVPGIGKKTAERLIVELKDQLKDLKLEIIEAKPGDRSPSRLREDALSALIHLGYHQTIAQKAIKKVFEEHPSTSQLPDLITLSLRYVHT